MTSFLKATHNLADMLALIQQGRYRTTKVAREGATRLGLDLDGMIAIVLDLPHSGL